jgi:branched-chain amino acid transport system substrate-binding protein
MIRFNDMVKRGTFLAISILGFGLAGISSSFGAENIKIGVMGPHTGPSARVGQDIQEGVNFALADALAAGDLPVVVDGVARNIEFVWVDSESSPEKGVRAVRRAIEEDKVDALMFGWHSSVGRAVIDVSAEYNKVHFGSLPATDTISKKIIDKGYTHYFKGWPVIGSLAKQYVVALNDWKAQGLWDPSVKKAALLLEDSDWGRGWGDAIKTGLIESGWEIVGEDVVKMDETAFGPIMTKYRALGATLVGFTHNAPASVFGIVKAHADAGLTGMLFAEGVGWYPDWYDRAGDAANYAVSMDSPRAMTTTQKEWLGRFKDEYDHDASPASGGHAYDYARMLIKGLAKAATLDSDTLSETLLNMEYTGIWQHYAFSKSAGDNAMAPYEVKTGPFMEGFSFPMVQYYEGKSQVIWPAEHAEGKFRAPPTR